MHSSQKIMDEAAAKRQIADWRLFSRKVVFTNGCFDLLHLGHVDYLEKARALGHRLVVGLNTDASVSALKGPSRPLNNEYARARVLAALACVDAVVLFGEETPYRLINALQPDVLVKGSDYQPEAIVGYDIVTARGGRVETIDFVEGFSTTGLIDKMRN